MICGCAAKEVMFKALVCKTRLQIICAAEHNCKPNYFNCEFAYLRNMAIAIVWHLAESLLQFVATGL